MSRLAVPRGSALVLGLLLAASLGAVTAILALPVAEPAALRPTAPSSVVPVTTRDDADERQVQLALSTGSPRMIGAPTSGVLTALSCAAGGTIRSGDRIASIDGEPVIALATETPLWRDLEPGSTGTDVRALQQELARLGATVSTDGVVGPSTERAIRTFLRARGITTGTTSTPRTDRGDEVSASSDEVLHTTSIAWVPGPETLVQNCVGVVGSRIDLTDPLVELPVELRSARIEQLPVDPAPGARVAHIGTVTAPIGSDGVISDPAALAQLTATPEYATAVATTTPTMQGRWSLEQPVEVAVVPPTALWDLSNGHGCVRPVRAGRPGAPLLVEVVGSELGQSFVRTGTPLRSVVAAPSSRTSCR